MGNQSSQRIRQKQKYSLDIYQTQKERKVLQWRSNPTINQFIPKVFLQYQDQQQQVSILNKCKINQNLPIGIRFQNFIGNLTVLKGKLRFQESLYVLKSLLTGYQVILSYFGKVVVNPNYCFVTKEGQVKAWINSDFRKNTFESEDKKGMQSVTEGQKLFLQPQEWIDQNKLTSSTANIINSIFKMVQDVNPDKKEIKGFMKIVDAFILENILKNYDFDRILRFTNKFIHQQKLFVKSNLLDVITRIHESHRNQQSAIEIKTWSHENKNNVYTFTQKEHVKENTEIQSDVTKQMKLRKCFSGRQSSGRSFTYNGPHFAKKSTFFESTQNSNGNTKFSTISNKNIDNLKEYVSSSKCSSRQGTYSQFQTKSCHRKNFISPQFSYNHFTNTNNVPNVHKKTISFVSTPKSSCIPSKNHINVNFNGSNQSSLKIITENKQSVNEIKNLKQNKRTQITQTNNIFTMKTITKLISSNGQISNQHESQGDFPSNQNISSYSGILASMGRSAQLVQVPSLKGIGFKNDKKLKTMMFTSSNPPKNNAFMSTNIFETQ